MLGVLFSLVSVMVLNDRASVMLSYVIAPSVGCSLILKFRKLPLSLASPCEEPGAGLESSSGRMYL